MEKSFESHKLVCMEDPCNDDTLQRAMAMDHDMIYASNFVTVYSLHTTHPVLKGIHCDGNVDARTVKRDWEQRPKWGQALGESTILEFKHQVKQLFDDGSAEPAKKLSAYRMQKLLHGLHPHRYDLPTEKQVQSLITGFCQDEKRMRQQAAVIRLQHTQ